MVLSPDWTRIAYVAPADGKQCVVVDGQEGKHYDLIGAGLIGVGRVVFSPDGRHVAYAARSDGKWFIVVDGEEGKRYDEIEADHVPFSILFSADSKRIAYRARVGDEWVVVVDGQEGKRYDGLGSRSVSYTHERMDYGVICGPPIAFSPDGARLAYLATLDEKWFVVVDAQEGKHYDNVVMPEHVFSPNSKRTAYWAQENDQWFTVVDGEQGQPYDVAGILLMADSSGCLVTGIGSLVFSPDSKRLAYVAQQGEEDEDLECHLVVDGQDWSRPDCVVSPGPIFSPDSTRVAYPEWSWSGDNDEFRVAVVVDDERGTRYEHVGTPVFSPDSHQMAYAAYDGTKWFVVLDGEEGKAYDDIGTELASAQWDAGVIPVGYLIFSPDSKRLAYGAQVGDEWLVVVDGREGKRYDAIGMNSLVFSPDSRRIAYTARTGDEEFVVVDGQEHKHYRGIGSVVFDSPESLRYIAFGIFGIDGKTLYLVEEKLE